MYCGVNHSLCVDSSLDNQESRTLVDAGLGWDDVDQLVDLVNSVIN